MALMPKFDFGVYISGWAATMPAWNVVSSARAASSSTFGASRPNTSVIRCSRPVTIVLRVQEAAEHRLQSHDVEIVAVDDTRADLARLAQADHREADRREGPDA